MANSLWLIAGLGNPGEAYDRTRHNTGFIALDRILHENQSEQAWQNSAKHMARIWRGCLFGQDLVLVKPQTYMNASGRAVHSVAHYYKIATNRIIVIHDDLDLPCGKIRIKQGGGTGGHKGVESIRQELGTDQFVRIRVGIGKEAWFRNGTFTKGYTEAADYVLQEFAKKEMVCLQNTWSQVAQATAVLVAGDLAKAMNQFN
ncbi:MAG TPA: aminoacyl-tRNA hydrolase [bacterium]|nr:aminoacyl-tRNA hydrolase [bacterium]